MLLKETDTIDAILIMVLEQIKFVLNPNWELPSPCLDSFVTSVFSLLRVTGKQVTSRKLFAGSPYHLPLRRVILFFPGVNVTNKFLPLFIRCWGQWESRGYLLEMKNLEATPTKQNLGIS